ncbi:MAG: DUF502 domain-containing protein [Rhodospirillaceae bacterium]|nr:MAG: DUF502 domain-containing protein [Rhodospirillaceae bacterium]
MTSAPPALPEPVIEPLRVSPAARLRNYFLAGILVTAPISITIYFTWSIVTWVDQAVAKVLPPAYNPNTYLPFSLPGLGLLMLVMTLTIIGFLTANFLGRTLIRLGEGLLNRTPIIRSFYSAIKQIFETVLKDKSRAFREVVLMEFPRSGTWALGLVIAQTEGEIRDRLPEDLLSVFVPTAPNPTSGYLIFVPRADAIRLDMTVEDALKMIISGGLVTPNRKPA